MSEAADILAFLDSKTAPKLFAKAPKLPDPQAIRQEVVRAMLHRRHKHRTPRYVLNILHAEYKRQPSLAAAGDVFGVTGSALFYLFKKHRLPKKSRLVKHRIEHRCRMFTYEGKYYRHYSRKTGAVFLHRVLWEERHGPIAPGHRLIFTGTDHADFSDASWRCVDRPEYLKYIASCRRRSKTSPPPP